MPRYFFHLNECGQVTRDEEGREIAIEADVRLLAIEEARTIMAAEVARGKLCLACHIEVEDESGARFVLRPQVRYFTTPATTTNESAIATRWNGQLYTVLGALGDDGRWQLRLWWKPFVTLIWLGGAMIAFGGLLSLVGHQWRLWRTKQRAELYA